MTARWSGVFFGARGNAASKWIWKANAGGFSHGARQTASEDRVSTGARDEGSSVVETEFEALWCRSRGTPQGLTRAATPSDGRGD
jgi:hypothetical protein